MKAENYWQLFERTGNPKDYLFYKEKEREIQEKISGKAGEYAGSGKSNGNGIEDGAYRGFR